MLEGKRRKMLDAINPSHRARGPEERIGLVGVGNSVYDVPFLSQVPHKSAWVVRPSQRLRRISAKNGWDMSFATVRGSGIHSPALGRVSRKGMVSRVTEAVSEHMEVALVIFYTGVGCGLWLGAGFLSRVRQRLFGRM